MQKKLDDHTMSVLCRQMAVMLRAGVGTQEAVEALRDGAEKPALEALEGLKAKMGSMSLAAAVKQTGRFPGYVEDLLQIGEMTGRMDQSLAALSDYYARQAAFKERLDNALKYPLGLLILMCGVLGVLVFAVMPMFQGVYTNLSGSLAASPYAYVAVAEAVAKIGLCLAAAACVLLMGLVLTAVGTRGKRFVLNVFAKAHRVRDALRRMELSRLSSMLQALLSSGYGADATMDVIASMGEFALLAEPLSACAADVRIGENLTQSFRRYELFPAMYASMLIAAQASGSLEAELAYVGDSLGKEGMGMLADMTGMAEPILTGFLTIVVGASLLATMLPLIGLMGAIG